MNELLLIRINCPDNRVADAISEALISARLAPCTNREGPVTSTYVWEGKVERTEEWVLWVKALARHWGAIKTLARAHHPDDVPAILAVPLAHVTADFAKWVVDNSAPAAP